MGCGVLGVYSTVGYGLWSVGYGMWSVNSKVCTSVYSMNTCIVIYSTYQYVLYSVYTIYSIQ